MNNSAAIEREVDKILKSRAKTLAQTPSDLAGRAVLEVIEFSLAAERYAIAASCVSEVVPLDDLAPLPGTPAFLAGIVNVRGRIVAVLDLKFLFELDRTGIVDAHQVLIVKSEAVEIGILADTVAGMVSVPIDAISKSLPTLTGIRAEYLFGVTADRLAILDAKQIANDSRIVIDASTSDT